MLEISVNQIETYLGVFNSWLQVWGLVNFKGGANGAKQIDL